MNVKFPAFKSGSYTMMHALHTHGPMTAHQVAEHISGGKERVNVSLQAWIERGWVLFDKGVFSLTSKATNFFDGATESKKPVGGIPATGCTFNMLTRPPYKSPRTYRREGPAWAQRPASFGFVTISGVQP